MRAVPHGSWVEFRSVRGRWAGLSLVVACLIAPSVNAQSTASLGEIEEVLRRSWESRSSFLVETVDEQIGWVTGSKPDVSPGQYRLKFAYGPRGQMAMSLTEQDFGGNSRLIQQFQADGKRVSGVVAFDGHPNVPSELIVNAQQTNLVDRYPGVMTGYLWLLMPSGRPLHSLIREHARLLPSKPAEEPVLEVRSDGVQFRCWLSPEHDFQPSRVALDETSFMKATKFESFNGHWVPTEGEYTQPAGDGLVALMKFKVVKASVNEPLADSLFSIPQVPDGVIVRDETQKKPDKRAAIQGGPSARQALEKRFGKEVQPVPTPLGSEPGNRHVAAGPGLRGSSGNSVIAWALGLVSAGLLLVGTVLAIRGRYSRAD